MHGARPGQARQVGVRAERKKEVEVEGQMSSAEDLERPVRA